MFAPHCLSGELPRNRVFIKKSCDYVNQNIRLLTGRNVFAAVDPGKREVLLAAGAQSYDKLIIAIGSRPFIPPIRGAEKKGVFRFKCLEDTDALCRWGGEVAAVIGSGPIGVETAIALNGRGYQVNLVESFGVILPQVFDKYPASIVQEILQRKGIRVFVGERVVEILGDGSAKGVVTTGGKIACNTVVMATGARRDTALAAGKMGTGNLGGILTEERMWTGVPDIYACGDCVETKSIITGRPVLSLLWPNARTQGEVVAFNAAGVNRRYRGSINVIGLNFFSTQAVSVGLTSAEVDNGLDVVERKRGSRYQRLTGVSGIKRLRVPNRPTGAALANRGL